MIKLSVFAMRAGLEMSAIRVAICHVLPTKAFVTSTKIRIYSFATASPTSGSCELAMNANEV